MMLLVFRVCGLFSCTPGKAIFAVSCERDTRLYNDLTAPAERLEHPEGHSHGIFQKR